MRISGYVPCFKAEATISQTIKSLQNQTRALDEIFVIDDGSTDASAARARTAGARVLPLEKNSGRGAVRARAMLEATGELILACDATARLEPNFLEMAIPHFEDKKTAAVFGRIFDPSPIGVTGRWRNRHLFKAEEERKREHGASLATWGVLMRKEAVLEVGNFDERLRHAEDAELGKRLARAGWDIIFDPAARVYPLANNSVPELLERYWRWHVGAEEKFHLQRYFKQVAYSITVLARRDFRAGDPACALISLLTPHYSLWRALRS